MQDPKEFEEDGRVVVEGTCVACGSTIRTTIEEVQVNG
jgi:hypothetical protein